jgi:hypothetical protein
MNAVIIQSLFLQLGKNLNMVISVSQVSRRQFSKPRKILHSLQLNKVGSLVTVQTAQRNVRMPISIQEDYEQLSRHEW